ncbi:hypothetical protein Q5752_001473 [Cryptotrichosporon argae]
MSSRPASTSASAPGINPTVPVAIHHLAAPAPRLLDAQLPAYLLPQAIAALTASATHVVRRRLGAEAEMREQGLLPPLLTGSGKGKEKETEPDAAMVEGEVAARLERMGQLVGGYVAEKLTLARPPLATHLDVIKFICKDLFLFVYSKQIDNLRTNHRGTFVLQSHAFPPLAAISSSAGPAADLEAARLHLVFPQALIQGALGRLGMAAAVTAESSGLPQCTFHIRTLAPKTAAPTPSTTAAPHFAGPPAAITPSSATTQPPAPLPAHPEQGYAVPEQGLAIAGAPV